MRPIGEGDMHQRKHGTGWRWLRIPPPGTAGLSTTTKVPFHLAAHKPGRTDSLLQPGQQYRAAWCVRLPNGTLNHCRDVRHTLDAHVTVIRITCMLDKRVFARLQHTCIVMRHIRAQRGKAHHGHVWHRAVFRQLHRPQDQHKKVLTSRARRHQERFTWYRLPVSSSHAQQAAICTDSACCWAMRSAMAAALSGE